MNKQEKIEIVSEIKNMLDGADAVYLVDYRGIDVADISEIRRKFRNEDIKYKVYKNTLFKNAIESTEKFSSFNDLLVGMTGFAFTGENYVAAAKIIKQYYDKNKKFVFKGCVIEDNFYDSTKLDLLASMPRSFRSNRQCLPVIRPRR